MYKRCQKGLLLLFTFIPLFLFSQGNARFSKYEYLHGKLNPLRTCFDVKHYEITVKVEPAKKFISGKNAITFQVVKDFDKLQLDFFTVMQISNIMLDDSIGLSFLRDSSVTYVKMGRTLKKGSYHTMEVDFLGNPPAAHKAPWDGGFVWTKDSTGKDWVGLACEGLGASCWLPCKDHLSDEADSMKMHLIVPENLTGVSNGKLLAAHEAVNGFRQFDWEVHNPINNYNITINAGNYAHIHDTYFSRFSKKELPLDYYVLRQHEDTAKLHFAQVKTMLDCFEDHFGSYPFWRDGYKLVQTPYWGMEHQSCISYGNGFANNVWDFDFIIVHESGHEWFGNSLSCNDPAEMWIHESFTTYSEAIYVECRSGYPQALKYLAMQRKNVANKVPMIGPYDVYYHGRKDNDIYYKGTWMLSTMRSVIDNDTTWFRLLRELNFRFIKKNVTTADILHFFNTNTSIKWDAFFKQYLYRADIPELEYQVSEKESRLEVKFRWTNAVKGFEIPIKMTLTKGNFETVVPGSSWQVADLNYLNPQEFKIQMDRMLFKVKEVK